MARKAIKATLETLVTQAQLERRDTEVKLVLTVRKAIKATPGTLVTQVPPDLKEEPEIPATREQLATEAEAPP